MAEKGKKKKGPPFLTVYTVSSIDDKALDPMDSCTSGSFVRRGDAIRECANYILERMELRQDIRAAVYLDENHKLKEALAKEFEVEWVERVLLGDDDNFSWEENESYRDLKKFLFDHFVDELGGQSCYYVDATLPDEGTCKFCFDVTENDVEGTMDAWTCVTSGRTDNEDEQFEQAFPEIFLSKKEAFKCAIEDLKQYLEDADEKYVKDILKDAKDNLRKFGKFCYELNDSAMRRWDIWYTPITLSGEIPEMSLTRRKKPKER